MSDKSASLHFTQRPGFVLAVGLLVVSLYFVWVAFGAAPSVFSFFDEKSEAGVTPMNMEGVEVESAAMEGMAMGGHGSGVGALTPDEFTELTEKFIDDLSLEDGSVRPTREWTEALEGNDASAEADNAAMNELSGEMAGDGDPIDVYVMAQRFAYEPRVLRLEKDTQYRFRVMSMDVNHGASIHTGLAGHIMRRPAKVLTEMVMTFTEPGDYMVYCTVYCGAGHDQMKGKIIVE